MYDRYKLMFAAEGPVPGKILKDVLSGYCSINLKSPFKKHIVLVAAAHFPVAVFNGRKDESQPFLGVYRLAGSMTDADVEELTKSEQEVIDFLGTLEGSASALSVRSRCGGRHFNEGAAILVTRGVQVGPFIPTFGGSGPKLFEVGRDDSQNRVFRAEFDTEAEADELKAMMRELLGDGRKVRFGENPNTVAVADCFYDLRDDEIRKLMKNPNATAAELEAFRNFVRRRANG